MNQFPNWDLCCSRIRPWTHTVELQWSLAHILEGADSGSESLTGSREISRPGEISDKSPLPLKKKCHGDILFQIGCEATKSEAKGCQWPNSPTRQYRHHRHGGSLLFAITFLPLSLKYGTQSFSKGYPAEKNEISPLIWWRHDTSQAPRLASLLEFGPLTWMSSDLFDLNLLDKVQRGAQHLLGGTHSQPSYHQNEDSEWTEQRNPPINLEHPRRVAVLIILDMGQIMQIPYLTNLKATWRIPVGNTTTVLSKAFLLEILRGWRQHPTKDF